MLFLLLPTSGVPFLERQLKTKLNLARDVVVGRIEHAAGGRKVPRLAELGCVCRPDAMDEEGTRVARLTV